MSGQFFDGIATADHSAIQNATKHAPPSPQLFLKSGTNGLHQIARGAYRADFQTRFADAEDLAHLQAIHVQAPGGDVLADRSGPQAQGLQSLAIHEQNLALASGPRMLAAFKAGVTPRTDLGEFLHRQVLPRSAEKTVHSRHWR